MATTSNRYRTMLIAEGSWPDLPVGQFARIDTHSRMPKVNTMFAVQWKSGPQNSPSFVLCRKLVDRNVFQSDSDEPDWHICFGYTPALIGSDDGFLPARIKSGDMVPHGYLREVIIGEVVGVHKGGQIDAIDVRKVPGGRLVRLPPHKISER